MLCDGATLNATFMHLFLTNAIVSMVMIVFFSFTLPLTFPDMNHQLLFYVLVYALLSLNFRCVLQAWFYEGVYISVGVTDR